MRPVVVLPVLAALVFAAGVSIGETFVWVDEAGVTHITDDPDAVPSGAGHGRDALRDAWDDVRGDEVLAAPAEGLLGRDEVRTRRLIAGAVSDLQRGENARAAVALRSILREQPARPEPHWYLALLDRHRGRYDSAEVHLRAFLASAGDEFEAWRVSAKRRLEAIEDERRLADEALTTSSGDWVEVASRHFRVHYDPELGRAASDYAGTVLRYLGEARRSVGKRLGTLPAERMGVVFYGRAAYQRAHSHRFSFQTVGFFDGRIHVVSAAHPAGELRALLFHEYVHAVYREQTGGDQPYWLNEGLAELSERDSRSQPGLTRSERSLLKGRIEADEWLSLRRLAPSFSGLDDEEARAAYLEAAAAASWIEGQTRGTQRAQILAGLGAGLLDDDVFRDVLGLDTEAIDRAVRVFILSEFPDRPLPTSQMP